MVFATGFTVECERLAAYNEILILAFSTELKKQDEVNMGAMNWKQFGGDISIATR
jgi:hypothetical protein